MFIINPISGVSKKKNLPFLINQLLDKTKFNYTTIFTEYPKHGKEITHSHQHLQDIIVAVGGDGTINEIGSSLINSKCALAIVPSGSGNGLARDLGVALNVKQAISNLNTASFKKIDTCYINERPFFCTAGIGFDADVAHTFAQSGSRGLKTYALSVVKTLFKKKKINLELAIDNNTTSHTVSSITFANAKQFGNNFKIAPQASLSDGIIDICLINTVSISSIIPLFIKLLNGKVNDLKNYTHYTSENDITIQLRSEQNIHIDGEATSMKPTQITIRNEKQNLIIYK